MAIAHRVVRYDHETDRYLKSRIAYRVIDRNTGYEVDELEVGLTKSQIKARLEELETAIYSNPEGSGTSV